MNKKIFKNQEEETAYQQRRKEKNRKERLKKSSKERREKRQQKVDKKRKAEKFCEDFKPIKVCELLVRQSVKLQKKSRNLLHKYLEDGRARKFFAFALSKLDERAGFIEKTEVRKEFETLFREVIVRKQYFVLK